MMANKYNMDGIMLVIYLLVFYHGKHPKHLATSRKWYLIKHKETPSPSI